MTLCNIWDETPKLSGMDEMAYMQLFVGDISDEICHGYRYSWVGNQ